MKRVKVTDGEYAEGFKDLRLEERHLVAIQQALPMESKKVLDVGCANGKTLKHIERYKPEATGIDKVKPLIDNAKKNTRFPVMIGDANSIPFKDGSFDIVLCLDMIEHTWTPGQALSEISRVTKKGGRIVLSTDGPYCKWSFRRGSWQQVENTQDPITLILRTSIKGLKIHRLIGLGNTFSTISSKNPLKRFIIRCGDKIVDLLYKLNIGWLFPNTLIIVAIKS